SLFFSGAVVVDIKADRHEEPGPVHGRLPVRDWRWTAADEPVALSQNPDGLWTPLWIGVDHFEIAKFGVIRGVAGESGKFRIEASFSARGRDVRGGVMAFQGL